MFVFFLKILKILVFQDALAGILGPVTGLISISNLKCNKIFNKSKVSDDLLMGWSFLRN